MESAKTRPCTYRNLVFQFIGESMHCPINCVEVISYSLGKKIMFIPHITYKNKLWISELNINNKTINKLEENTKFF